jgi:cytochrome c oxidase subunit II
VRLRRSLPLLLATPLLAGCGRQSALDAGSPQQHKIVLLFWVMTGVAAFGVALILFLLWLGWRRRNRNEAPGGQRRATVLLILLGVVAPIVSLSALFVWSDVFVLRATSAPKPSSTALTVEVIGHQWWWEVRYPGTPAVTANEIHIPAGERVNVVGRTADVIHSFWVPALNRKIDLIPGRTNRIVLDATDPGRYRGQCYEFCGLQHAHMGLWVVADPPARFRTWLAQQGQPATAGGEGRDAFLAEACATCHTIRGTPASGDAGPDLTHLASRQTIAGALLPNTRQGLTDWIDDPQHFKPGNHMPALGLPQSEIRSIVAYLERLK